MRRLHAIGISILLGSAATAGAAAVLETTHLGAASAAKPAVVPAGILVARRAKLEAMRVALVKARAARPPALPPVPAFAPVTVPAQAAAPAAPRTLAAAATAGAPAAAARPAAAPAKPQITYVQPPPIVKYVPAPQPAAPTVAAPSWHGDDGGESEGGNGGSDDSGGDD